MLVVVSRFRFWPCFRVCFLCCVCVCAFVCWLFVLAAGAGADAVDVAVAVAVAVVAVVVVVVATLEGGRDSRRKRSGQDADISGAAACFD